MKHAKHRRLAFVVLLATQLIACSENNDHSTLVGQLESDRVEITAEFAEPITRINVKEGEQVTAGTLLVQQDTQRITAQLAAAKATTAKAQAYLDELIRGPRKEKIAAAQAALDSAKTAQQYRQTEYNRLQKLFQQQLISGETHDKAYTELQTANAQVNTSKAQLEELLNGTTVETLEQARQALALAQAQQDSIQLNAQRHQLIAPIDSIVDSRLFEVGERPQAGQPVIILLSGKQPYARLYVPETQRSKLHVGDMVSVTMDGDTETYQGKVRFIADEAAFTPYFALTEKDRGKLTYLAKVDIVGANHRLPDGMPVQVNINP